MAQCRNDEQLIMVLPTILSKVLKAAHMNTILGEHHEGLKFSTP
jgi:hypothetical protein